MGRRRAEAIAMALFGALPVTAMSAAASTVSAVPSLSSSPGSPGSAVPSSRPSALVEGPTDYWPETGFGGYWTSVRVFQISAQLTVPSVEARSSVGAASTWIGAQSTDGPPFVQVGIVEEKPSGRDASYQLFWSDPDVGYLAQPMGAVAPGDLVAVSMRHDPGGWRFTFKDKTTGTSATKSITYGAIGAFTQAEWVQEDPAPATVAANDVPYPKLSTVTFSHLLVNARPPTLKLRDSESLMTFDKGDYVPTPVSGDAFSLVRPTGAGLRYLVFAGSIDAVASRLDALLVLWRHVPQPFRVAAATDLVGAYYRFDARLASRTWPQGARHAIVALIHQDAVVAGAIRRWIASGLSIGGPYYARMVRATRSRASRRVRTALGLPPS